MARDNLLVPARAVKRRWLRTVIRLSAYLNQSRARVRCNGMHACTYTRVYIYERARCVRVWSRRFSPS